MSKVTCDIGMSVDGFVAGPDQSLEEPLGKGGEELHRWMFEQPEQNADAIAGILESGAYIMGRNMFASGRGEWDLNWRGWWGEEPPYHAPVCVLTHYPREPLTMSGGTVFNFVTDGIQSAMSQARDAAGEKGVAIAGGAATVQQFLAAGLIDELRLHIAPIVLGAGERLFERVGNVKLEQLDVSGSDLVTHVRYRVTL